MTPRLPKFRLHKASGQGFIELNGKRIYLGKYGLPETEENYRRHLSEWLASERQAAGAFPALNVAALVVRFFSHAEAYYLDARGEKTSEIDALKSATRPLVQLYGSTPAASFGPRALKAVRERMIQNGWTRYTINKHVGRVKSVFKWAVGNELLPGEVYHALQAVDGLKRGRSGAKESTPVRPVSEDDVQAIRPHVSRQVWAIVELQLLTAARAGELVPLRPADVDRSGSVWIYTPANHKTAHHGISRTIYLGPKAQKALGPFLFRPEWQCCFSPIEAEAERLERKHAERKTPPGQGNEPGTNRRRRPRVKPGSCYTVGSYGRAIRRGCEDAKITPWHSHQLRHSAATNLRRMFGIEVARIVLGHTSPAMTELYAEIDRTRAVEAIQQTG